MTPYMKFALCQLHVYSITQRLTILLNIPIVISRDLHECVQLLVQWQSLDDQDIQEIQWRVHQGLRLREILCCLRASPLGTYGTSTDRCLGVFPAFTGSSGSIITSAASVSNDSALLGTGQPCKCIKALASMDKMGLRILLRRPGAKCPRFDGRYRYTPRNSIAFCSTSTDSYVLFNLWRI